MTDDRNLVRLLVNGTDFGGWKSVSISAGIDRQARDFDLSVTDRWPGSDVPRRIAPGDACQVFIGADLVLTGYVDGTPISYDAKSVTVSVKGRSKTADLVDCSAIHEPGQFKGRKVEQIAAELAAPYGVTVLAAVDTGAPIADHQVQQGESVFESVDRMLKLRALLSTDDAEGRLVLTRAGSTRAATDLVVGENLLTGSASLDCKDRFSEYRIKGQRTADGAAGDEDEDAGDDGDGPDIGAISGDAAATSQVMAVQADTGIRRKRVLVIVADGQPDGGTARERARWEAAHRAGKSFETSYTVQGWRQADGRLWVPNELVRVRDPIIGFDLDMLISAVGYSLSESGSVTTLTVAPKAAYELLPETPQAKGKGKTGATLTPPIVEFD
ncbi:baseplate protein [Azospirillum formosense]|uniref:Baseplate protein n=1 Tax=Azospirillum formosense TaxID=861533 RepID=A0ABX2KW11_9PROT|nr:contractile injection system protein, VgrG/Pvc8 family [Azospirillum formosense]MBY3755729.1 baseplate protein [Azospirillum formosense]NUB18395.1 baseplate protein [Azospirillum formosense]